MNLGTQLLLALWLTTGVACAAANRPMPVQGTVQVLFSPGEAPAEAIVDAIRGARKQVLVQAYSFTDKAIANALVEAHRRGLDVRVIADADQARILKTSRIEDIAERGVPIWFDEEHAIAHNKVMIIDAGTAQATVLTGSYNFTQAARTRNAENLLILRGSAELTARYLDNWQQHFRHSRPARRGR
jgi:phosphatidylserine/phosphatidylglycerophosphate/cardiolipin synthase-like enzyme